MPLKASKRKLAPVSRAFSKAAPCRASHQTRRTQQYGRRVPNHEEHGAAHEEILHPHPPRQHQGRVYPQRVRNRRQGSKRQGNRRVDPPPVRSLLRLWKVSSHGGRSARCGGGCRIGTAQKSAMEMPSRLVLFSCERLPHQSLI